MASVASSSVQSSGPLGGQCSEVGLVITPEILSDFRKALC